MILVDSSAWVEYDRATGSAVHLRVRQLLAAAGMIAVTEPIIMEVVAGARDDARERDLRRLLAVPELIRFEPVADFDGAASIYRSCRKRGVTPRGMIDCMIAAVALRTGSAVLALDADMVRLGDVIPLRLDEAAPGTRT